MVKWIVSYILDRAMIALALYVAYLAFGEPLQRSSRQLWTVTDQFTSPFERISQALE